VVNVAQRNSIYQTIERLLRDGLIRCRQRAVEPSGKDRLQITPGGDAAGVVKTMLSAPAVSSQVPRGRWRSCPSSRWRRREALAQRVSALGAPALSLLDGDMAGEHVPAAHLPGRVDTSAPCSPPSSTRQVDGRGPRHRQLVWRFEPWAG
jgi:hypothetical protein